MEYKRIDNYICPATFISMITSIVSDGFLRSGLRIMFGERVGIQVLQHNTNQIKTREKPSPKPADTAEVGALECYIKAARMLELMSASNMKCRKPDFNSWRDPRHFSRTDRQQVIQKPPMTQHRYI
jgi:hypothetical protein